MADVIDRLDSLCNYAGKALKEVNQNTKDLFIMIAQDAMECKFDFTDAHQDFINDIKHHGKIYDCASFIQRRVLDSNKSKCMDFDLTKVNRSLDNLNEHISSALHDAKLFDRQFVYFAWRIRPEEYHYVGRAKSGSRLNLAAHGKLLESLKNASRFSCIFPERYADETEVVSNLEAALINLIHFKTGCFPEQNKRKEKFEFGYECSRELLEIKNLIAKIQKQIE